jgi:hypothetical protein
MKWMQQRRYWSLVANFVRVNSVWRWPAIHWREQHHYNEHADKDKHKDNENNNGGFRHFFLSNGVYICIGKKK